eukprot:Hpha_TRINITY_DN14376_c0_g1::TRINITY_DN14376_c0_g1_i3::g.86714::m.86714
MELCLTDALGRRESYHLVERMMWLGLGGKLNDFRSRVLGLGRIRNGGGRAHRLQVPHVYCMSESLLARPTDWGPHISMTGFWFLDTGGDGGGPQELKDFCEKGTRAPIYIGFGSIQTPDLHDVDVLTRNVYEALRRVRALDAYHGLEPLRAIVQCCEGGFFDKIPPPPEIEVLVWKSGVAHDWLFPLCSAVCHHGGAGTLSAGLRAGKPTVVIPFFGDQPFWGNIVKANNLGACVHIRDALKDIQKLVDAFSVCQDPHIQRRAKDLGALLHQENGVLKGVRAFHHHLPLHNDGDGGVRYVVECFENQRYYPLIGWSDSRLPCDRYAWSDRSGCMKRIRHAFDLPRGWRWCGEWEVDLNAWQSDGTGFQYATAWTFEFYPRQAATHFVRRRRWIRHREYIGDERPNSSRAQMAPLRAGSGSSGVSSRRMSNPFRRFSGPRSPFSRGGTVERLEEELRTMKEEQSRILQEMLQKDQVIESLKKNLGEGGQEGRKAGPQQPGGGEEEEEVADSMFKSAESVTDLGDVDIEDPPHFQSIHTPKDEQ